MSAIDNGLFVAVRQLAGTYKDSPEGIIWGYAKLLCMDEKMVQIMVGEGENDDLEEAHIAFDKLGLNAELIKGRMQAFITCINKDEEREKKLKQFEDFIEAGDGPTGSKAIITKVIKLAAFDIKAIFGAKADEDSIDEAFDEVKADHIAFMEKIKSEASAGGDGTPKKEEKKEAKEAKETPENPSVPLVKPPVLLPIEEMDIDGTEDKGDEYEEEEDDDTEDRQTLSALSDELKKLSITLADVVKGQEAAILKFIKGYSQGELLKNSEDRKAPKSYFFFFGPPGVGKTLLANTAADALGLPFKVFNMSEYAGHQAHEELLGTASFYNNSKEGTLVKFVREHPECVILFDEIEKAHLNVIRQFLQILGSGTLDNKNKDKQISFKNTIIIFTSNVGRKLFSDRSVNFASLPDKVLTDLIANEKDENGRTVLPVEICSRIASGTPIMFNHLSVRQLSGLVRTNFDRVVEGMKKEYGVRVTYSDFLPLLFLYSYGGEIDARVATSQSGNFIKNEIYELLRQMENCKEKKDGINSIKIDVDWKGIEPELKRLFINNDTSEVLIFADKDSTVFDSINKKKYVVYRTDDINEAREYLKNDLAAIFIDPELGSGSENETVLSITDYNTDGVRFFHEIIETQANIPTFLLETGRIMTDVDRDTFFQEGATGFVKAAGLSAASFKRNFDQIMEEIYMEAENQRFTQRGFVIGFGTKQEIGDDGKVKILFYDIKKKIAVDSESRGSILLDSERPNVHFRDVIGAGKAKEKLGSFVEYIKNPKKFLAAGGKPSKGVLLYGPPGTGKTMLARAMAGESDVTFIQSSATDFMDPYFGKSEENIRELFKRAKRYAPSIIFIDEIDAIGKRRTGSSNDSATEKMLNTLLTQMDGFATSDPLKPVFVLAATNYGASENDDGIEMLDQALVRRFKDRVKVDLPNEDERKEFILKFVNDRDIKSISDEAINNIASRTTGQSLAILQNVLDSAHENALKDLRDMKDDDVLTSLEDYVYGEKKTFSPEYYRRVAYHEVGHAYVSYLCGDKPRYITIESRGNFGGYMLHSSNEDRTGYTKDELLGLIRCSLAGRCSEQEFYDDSVAINTGASGDLKSATSVAFDIICQYGMEDSLVVMSRQEIMNSSLADEYLARVNRLLQQQLAETKKIISEGREVIEKIVDELVKENRLTGERFSQLMEENKKKDE